MTTRATVPASRAPAAEQRIPHVRHCGGAEGPRPPARFRKAGLWLTLALVMHVTPAFVPSLSAQDWGREKLPVVEYKLENGMRFLVLPRHTSPTVSFVLQYRVGSVNEAEGSTGIAHLLEQLLFKGTTTLGTRDVEAERRLFREMDALQDSILGEEDRGGDPNRISELRSRIESLEDRAQGFVVVGELDRILAENGARNSNATTTVDYTNYFVELPSNRSELWFVLESDRMAHPVFREFYAERDVVAEERRMRLETSPGGMIYTAHMAAAFRVHPYGVPVIGHMSDLQRLTRGELEAYHRRYYAPGNAVVAIVGDVEPDSVLTWARRYFGELEPGHRPGPVSVVEPPQVAERRVEVRFDAQPQVRIGWRTVPLSHPDSPALSMLGYLLTGGRTARLHRRLVREDQIASSVSAGGAPGLLYPGLFAVDAYPRAPHTTQEVERAIYQELEKLKETPPEEVELARVRSQMESSEIRGLRSNLGLAMQLANSASLFDDWRALFNYSRRIREVTPAHIQEVVRRYFTESNRTVATLIPTSPGSEGSP